MCGWRVCGKKGNGLITGAGNKESSRMSDRSSEEVELFTLSGGLAPLREKEGDLWVAVSSEGLPVAYCFWNESPGNINCWKALVGKQGLELREGFVGMGLLRVWGRKMCEESRELILYTVGQGNLGYMQEYLKKGGGIEVNGDFGASLLIKSLDIEHCRDRREMFGLLLVYCLRLNPDEKFFRDVSDRINVDILAQAEEMSHLSQMHNLVRMCDRKPEEAAENYNRLSCNRSLPQYQLTATGEGESE